ncbi:MAG: DUF1508 domain-containing protein [Candidatus Bathyarchaeota archaeon]|nr:DUF1508 domain-containing protein [Candidatus Bathyarchaeum tardum]WGM90067.1 MAG: DUF1508 domain-containing protein [Candidatus Bathyarchaeum tardum]WNZ29796.1 MAG: DUF1508 domain-containing protein [Candidatus Bathyarchaeota archaeon]
MKARYQVYKDVSGKYRFRLRGINNKIIVVSEAYENKSGVITGIKSIQKNCQSEIQDKTVETKNIPNPKYEIIVDTNFKFRFNLIAANGEIIGSSEGYNSKQGCKKGIEAVKKSCDADIEDLTTTKTEESIEKPEKQCEAIEQTGIAMMSPPNVVESGSTVTFEGWLINSQTGKGIQNSTIKILEHDRSFFGDSVLTSGVTDTDGYFSIQWKATQLDWWDDTVEIYAKFSGKGNCKPTRSANYQIQVQWYAKKKQ